MLAAHRIPGHLRGRAAVLAVLALASLALLSPAAAHADELEGRNSFNELSEKAAQQETTPAETTASTKTAETETHNSTKIIFIGLGAAAVLLAVIGFVIVRDARRVAPAGPDDIDDEGRRARDAAARRRNRRAKAKAARQQRKKNR